MKFFPCPFHIIVPSDFSLSTLSLSIIIIESPTFHSWLYNVRNHGVALRIVNDMFFTHRHSVIMEFMHLLSSLGVQVTKPVDTAESSCRELIRSDREP
jgi:hypothetical protein